MTYTKEGDKIRLEMTEGEWQHMLLLLGAAAGAASKTGMRGLWRWVKFANEVNRTNPDFRPYEIPKGFQDA